MTKKLTEDEKVLLLAEYEPLREEVNRTVDRMTANELACSAFVFSIVLFQFSTSNVTSIPDWIVVPFSASLAVIAAFVGFERSRVFRRHMDQVDNYLANLERQFRIRTHNQNMTVAARAIAERKTVGDLS
jgi:hypothetical protein